MIHLQTIITYKVLKKTHLKSFLTTLEKLQFLFFSLRDSLFPTARFIYGYIQQSTTSMKINNKDLDELITTLVGEDVLPLFHILLLKSNISEFKLAEMLNITVNQVRNMLYRLNEHTLVDFIRKKDKKKGWYIYYWSLNKKRLDGVTLKLKQKQLEDLKVRFSREKEGLFYVCPMGCMRLQMEQAMEYEFRCQECGTLMKEQDNQKTVSNIKKMISDLEQELQVQEEEKLKKNSLKQAREKKIAEKLEAKKIVKKAPVKKTEIKTAPAKKEAEKKAPAKEISGKKEVKKVLPKKALKKAVPKKVVKKKI